MSPSCFSIECVQQRSPPALTFSERLLPAVITMCVFAVFRSEMVQSAIGTPVAPIFCQPAAAWSPIMPAVARAMTGTGRSPDAISPSRSPASLRAGAADGSAGKTIGFGLQTSRVNGLGSGRWTGSARQQAFASRKARIPSPILLQFMTLLE
jgi:hypothetical protein